MRASTGVSDRVLVAVAATLFAASVVAGSVGTCVALEVKSSADFDWKYEMDVLPSIQDLDGSGAADFAAYGGLAVDGDILTMPVDAFLESPAGGLWQSQMTFAAGWTIEARVKVIEQTSGDTAWEVFAGAPGGSSSATLRVGAAAQGWNDGFSMGSANNADGFHVFRVAQLPGSDSYAVWRDEKVLATGIIAIYHVGNALWFGDGSSGWSGVAQVDYFRITSGAYSPVEDIPEPTLPVKDSLQFSMKYQMDVAPPAAELTLAGGASMIFDGMAKYATAADKSLDAWMESPGGGMWQGNFSNDEGYTIEVRLMADSGAQTSGWGIFASTGDTMMTTLLTIGSDGQGWGGPNLNLGEADNSDGQHVFRVVKKPGAAGFNVWRDGELIGENLGSGYNYAGDALWFGDGSGDWGGNVALDYIRFENGAYAPVPEPAIALLILLGGLSLLIRFARR